MKRALALLVVAACGGGSHPEQDAGVPDAPIVGSDATADTSPDSAPDAGPEPVVTVTDDGGLAIADVTYTPTALGQTSITTLHVTDTGAAPTGPITVAITGSSDFTIDAGATTCGPSLASGDSCVVVVQFSPSLAMQRDATLMLTSAAGTRSIGLHGLGFTSSFHFEPSSVTFGLIGTGETATRTVQLVNDAPADAPVDSIAAAGSGYTVAATACGATLGAGASCDITVHFETGSLGDKTGSLSAMSGGATYSADLDAHGARRITVGHNGTGTGTITSDPAGITCGTTCTGLFETDVTLTVSPDPGSTLTSWNFAGCPGTGSTCALPISPVPAQLTLSLMYTATAGVSVHFAGGGTGSVTVNNHPCSTDCMVAFTSGTLVTIRLQQPLGTITGACSTATSLAASCGLTVGNGTSSVTVTIPQDRWTRVLPDAYSFAAYDGSGDLILAGNTMLTKLAPDGSTLWSIASPAMMVATGPMDTIYVSDTTNLMKLDADGNVLWSITPIGGPHAIAVGDDGTVVGMTGASVTAWTSTGSTLWFQPVSDGEGGITIDHTGMVSVAVFDGVEDTNISELAADGTVLPDPGIRIDGYTPVLATTTDNRLVATSSGHSQIYLLDGTETVRFTSSAGALSTLGVAAPASGAANYAWFYFDDNVGNVAARIGVSPLEVHYSSGSTAVGNFGYQIAAAGVDGTGNLATVGAYVVDSNFVGTMVQTFAP